MFRDLIRKIVRKTTKAVTLPTAVRTSGGEFLLKKTDYGLVRVEFEVVRKISERALDSIRGIQESELTVEKFSTANPLKIRLTATLVEGYSAPRISEAADKAINAALKEFLQLEFYVPVEVRVEEIAKVVVPKRRRVR
jgi:uncharacterized alkaline shock family protein YloU